MKSTTSPCVGTELLEEYRRLVQVSKLVDSPIEQLNGHMADTLDTQLALLLVHVVQLQEQVLVLEED